MKLDKTIIRAAFFKGIPIFIFGIMVFSPAQWGMSHAAWITLGATLWIATWWITEAIPIPATSLLPIVLFPLFAGVPIGAVTSAYGHPTIFLFMGGFLIALAIERCNLHKRIALLVIYNIGRDKQKIILGFMLATFFISMWISNTAATLMMLPIALAVSSEIGSKPGSSASTEFGLPLLLGIAYAASIGGMGTLIGTPTNAMFSAIATDTLAQEVSFSKWLGMAFPLSLFLILTSWYLLTRQIFKISCDGSKANHVIHQQLQQLGSVSKDEWKVIAVFAITAMAWVCRSFLLESLIPGIDDTIISITGALTLFFIPSSGKKEGLLDWDTAKKLPWGVLLLFGGGLALTESFKHSGLASYFGDLLAEYANISHFSIVAIIVASVNFLTEVTSNVATVSIMLPILISLAEVLGLHPYSLMVGATLAASCAFMLPVATPPNAVVFASGYIRIKDMVKAGFTLNIISIIVITLYVYWIIPWIWNIS
jgi:solute carrier family 13 (sodium-dependent dicarboxylate transporter), member 2/3/5